MPVKVWRYDLDVVGHALAAVELWVWWFGCDAHGTDLFLDWTTSNHVEIFTFLVAIRLWRPGGG